MDVSPGPDESLFRALTLAARHVAAQVERRLGEEAGVSLPELEILTVLARSEGARARSGALAAMLAWEKSRLSHQVTRMERRGLVSKDACEADLRGTWVVLTAAGRSAAQAALPAYRAAVTEVLGALSLTIDGKVLTGLLNHIGSAVVPVECDPPLNAVTPGSGA